MEPEKQNALWLMFGRIMSAALGFVINLTIARSVGPDNFGLISFAWALVSLFQIVASCGIDEVVLSELVRNPERHESILVTSLVIRFFGACAASVLCVAVAYWAHAENQIVARLTFIASLTNFGNALLFLQQRYSALLKNRPVVFCTTAALFLVTILQFALATRNAALEAVTAVSAAQTVLAGVLLYFHYRWAGQGNLGFKKFEWAWARKLLSDSWPRVINGFAVASINNLGTLIVGMLLPALTLGQYSVANRIIFAIIALPGAVAQAIAPAVIVAEQSGDQAKFSAAMTRMYRSLFLIGLLFAFAVIIFAVWLLPIFYGRQYVPARSYLAVLALMLPFISMGQGRLWYVVSRKAYVYSMWLGILSAIINAGLLAILGYYWGVWGIIVAQVLVQIWATFLQDAASAKHRTNSNLAFRALWLWKSQS